MINSHAYIYLQEQLCRANVLVPVVLRLEDFGFNLSYEAVSLIIEFIYKGEVNIASNQLIGMAHAAHSLGIDGLKEFLPNTFADPTRSSESSRNGCNSSDCSPENISNKTKTTKASKRNIPGGTVACRPVTVTRKVKTSKAEIGGNKDSNIIDQDEFDSCDDIIVLDCEDEEDINITNDMKASSDDVVVSTCNKTIIKHDNKSNEEHSKKVSQMTDNDFAQKISLKDKSSETLKLHERNEILINTTNERTSPQTSQPPHSTNTDNEEEDIDSVYASSACEGTGNISEIQNDDGRNEVQKLTVNKSMVKSYEGFISTRPEGEECSSVEEVQHCSVGSSVPLPKNTNHSPQLVSSTSPMLSSHNSFINESTNNLNTENLSHENSINTVETEMQQENHNFQNEAGEHEASKSIPNVPSGIISPVTTEVHSRMSEVHENTITASSQDSQHCYIPITSSNNPNLLPLQSNSQSYQLFHPAAMPFVPSSEVVMKHNRPHIENQINLVNVPTTKIGQTLSTSTCSTASSQSLRTVSNTGKSKGKLRVINQVGTIVGNTTPNIQASSTGSEVNFHHAFGDDGRTNNTTTCNYNQTQQFFDTILSAQADGSLHFRPNNQIDNMMLSTSANSSEMYSTEGNNILGQHPDYGHPNSSDINVGNEEVTIIEEIAIGNQAESIPFNIPNNSGYQYQQPMHPDLNGFQTVSFTNDVVYHHSTPPHNQAQHHHRIQDHPPPPPLWMPTCPPPPLAAAPQQAFSAVAAHAVAQAAVAQHQNNYEELQAMTSNATINESGENMGSRNAINNILVGTDSTGNTWNCSQNSISYQVLDDNGCIRKRNGGALQKESKSKKEEFEDVQEYIEVDEEERRRVLNTTLSGVVVRTEPPDLDEVSWSVPHSPNMAIENHNHPDPIPSDRPTTNHPTTNWSWTTPAEDSIVDWSTRLASMTGNPQIHIENSSTGNTSQVSQNWHTLAVSTGTMPSNSLATPTSTISESPPLMLLSDSSAAATHSKPSHTSEANSMNPRSPIRIRHQSSDLVSLLATSKENSGPCSIVSEPSSNVEKEQKTSGLPLLADVAQVAAAAVSVKAEKSSIKNQKKRKKANSREEFEELCGSNDNRKGSFSIKRPNKGELEVRKDLTIPSASLQRKSEDEINVFQADILPSSSGLTNFLEPMEQNVVNSLYNNLPSIEQPVRSSKTRQRKKYCLDCSMTFVTTNRLKQHVRHAHRREEIFSCPTCSEQNLRGKENLKLHMYKCHGIGEIFRCEDCNFETSARAHFTKHTLTVHPSDPDGETDDSTAISGAPFGNKGNPGITIGCEGNLRSHDTSIGIATETQAKANVVRSHRFTCKYCTRGFKSKAGLKLHLQQHTNESMHHCMVCPFRTPQQQNLVKHLATKHKKSLDGEDLQADKECQFCEFKCVAQYQLKAHNLRKHTDRSDMKYKCNDCGYASVEKSALVKHIRFRHTKVRLRLHN
jgi:hypothetical protein